MNVFVLVLVIPTLLTVVSGATLFFSFKGRVDASGRYFLLAEFLWLIVLVFTAVFNAHTVPATSILFFIYSVCTLFSEVAILLSIQALTRRVDIKKLIYWIIFVVTYSAVIEYCRTFINPKSPLLLASVFSLLIAPITYIACVRINSNGLEENLFIKLIAYTELGLTVIHLFRLGSFFSESPMMALNPSPLPVLIFSLWLSINLLRYFSYQSLRVSWVDPRVDSDNPLNRNLVKLVKEKNQFLQGLISSNRALGISALANSLAHQLSQPITGIILQTESVKRDLLDSGTQPNSVHTLDTVKEQLIKLSALVNNLRKLFGHQELEFKTFNAIEACDEVLEIIVPTLESKNITLLKHYKNSPIAFGNPIQIQQVLINIFNNAIDEIETSNIATRQINLTISQNQNFAIFTVQDSGAGFTPETAKTMFELYQSTKKYGLGIGLWLSKTIIDKHDGVIRTLNHADEGAIFEIQIPLASSIGQDLRC